MAAASISTPRGSCGLPPASPGALQDPQVCSGSPEHKPCCFSRPEVLGLIFLVPEPWVGEPEVGSGASLLVENLCDCDIPPICGSLI